ncbi:uncharacterized protein [Drosophila kikkawai]|uniref:Transcription factor BTF3 n=1 Tax=Drosophila kikkawai TaxID=30033 RepID=A0A6P4I0G0_DROKI|nr:uncharacterized protein LOC108074188 [Drosophila kikkawai]
MNNQSKFKIIEDAVRIGGKGSMRRKRKRVPAAAPLEAKRLQASLEKLSIYQMPGIEQLTFSMDDKSERVIRMPHVQGDTGSNLLVISGTPKYVAAPYQKEPAKPPRRSPPPPPPPSPAFSNTKSVKKPKKSRNRIRLRNKCIRELLTAGAGDAGENIDLGSADDLLDSPRYFGVGGGDDDSDKTTVPSAGSDMDQTIVGDDFLNEFDVGEEKDSDEPQTGSEENDNDQDDDDDIDCENEDFQLTVDDMLSCLEEN